MALTFGEEVSLAAFDVAIERMTTLHPTHQAFVFGPKGERFGAQFPPNAEELELLERALIVLEEREAERAPMTVRGASGQFTAMVLDAERTVFAVLLTAPAKRLSSEVRVVPQHRAP